MTKSKPDCKKSRNLMKLNFSNQTEQKVKKIANVKGTIRQSFRQEKSTILLLRPKNKMDKNRVPENSLSVTCHKRQDK